MFSIDGFRTIPSIDTYHFRRSPVSAIGSMQSWNLSSDPGRCHPNRNVGVVSAVHLFDDSVALPFLAVRFDADGDHHFYTTVSY